MTPATHTLFEEAEDETRLTGDKEDIFKHVVAKL